MIGLQHYLTVSALLFSLGVFGVLTRKNAVSILMGIELILNSANINFVAFSRYTSAGLDGHIFVVFSIALAAAEAAVALAIILGIYHRLQTIDVDKAQELKG